MVKWFIVKIAYRCFNNYYMSSEHTSLNVNSVETPNTINLDLKSVSSDKKPRVNINTLLSKVRQKEKKEKKENLIFFVLISSVVVITGIIASL